MGIKEWGYEYRNLMQQEINSYIHPFKKRGFMNHLLWLGIIIVPLLNRFLSNQSWRFRR